MTVGKLRLAGSTNTAAQNIREAAQKRANAAGSETAAEAFARIGNMSLNDRERAQFEAARRAFMSGEITIKPRSNNAKWSKGDVLAAGAEVLRKREEGERSARIAETLRTKPANYHVITDNKNLPAMIGRLREEVRLQRNDPWFQRLFRLFDDTLIRRKLAERGIEIPAVASFTVWDTETSGVDTMIDLSGGYSFWLPLLNEGYYVAYGHLTDGPQCTRSAALDIIRAFFEQERHIKAFHNAEFDLAMFLNDSLTPRGIRYDSMDAQFILYDHEESYGLKPLFTKYKSLLGAEAAQMDDFTFEDLFGNGSPMIYEPEIVGIYAIKDVHKGWLLTKWQIDNMVAKDDLHVPYFEIRQYLPQVNVNIERTGFEVDLAEMARLESEFRERLEGARQALFETYRIDDNFLRKMSLTLNGDKIQAWLIAQEGRIAKQAEMLARCREDIKTANPATKRYAQLTERIRRYETEVLAEPIPENAPDFIREFNIDSNAHLAYLIYDVLKIRDRTKEIVKDKKRERAVSKDVLERYFGEEESLRPLSEYSQLSTLLGTFVEKIPQALDADGRIHTRLRTVSTGRYGSAGYSGKPNRLRVANITDDNYLATMRRLVDCSETVAKGTNLQNIPTRSIDGLRVRKTFKPRAGYAYLGSDLKAIEPRIQAHRMAAEFGDEIFAEMFRKKLDPYVEFASILFGVPKEVCLESYYNEKRGTPDEVPPYRDLMKTLFLAEGYGQAFDQFYKGVQKHGISEEHARRAYEKFDEVLPGFRRMVESTFDHLRKHGWAATIWHQKRRFPKYRQQWTRLQVLMRRAGIADKSDPDLGKKSSRLPWELRSEFWDLIRETGKAERQAFNHTIQGSGANVLQLCMIRSYYELVVGRGWEFNLTLHDEQKHSAPIEEITEEAVELYNDIMRNTVSLQCPLDCDTEIEKRWMEKVELSELKGV